MEIRDEQDNLLTDIEQETDFVEAPKGLRFANYILDNCFFMALCFIAGGLMGFGGFLEMLENVPPFILSIAFILGYYLPLEARTGRTVGKLITGTMAVKEDGTRLTFKEAALRTVCRLIPFDAFSFLGNRGWHDSISRTRVIKIRGSYRQPV